METGTVSTICYGVSASILIFWAIESALSRPGTAMLLLCGMLMAGVGLGLPRGL